jgi:hypothetical protein
MVRIFHFLQRQLQRYQIDKVENKFMTNENGHILFISLKFDILKLFVNTINNFDNLFH